MSPKVIVICGPPGAGKTTYGRKLAAKKNATFLDIDTVTEPMVRAGLAAAGRDPNDRDSPWFKQHFRTPIYETLFQIAIDNLATQNVVIVGPFTQEIRDPDWLEQLASRLQTEVEVHYVTCSPETRRQRMIDRGEPRDLPKLGDWETFLEYYNNESKPAFPHVLVDTDPS